MFTVSELKLSNVADMNLISSFDSFADPDLIGFLKVLWLDCDQNFNCRTVKLRTDLHRLNIFISF